ncbi:hypothetical protein [Halomicrobium salinisoli]|uniref:hypothetical protein n=1 Tax=Halomicrobium salinisoli TaxID=2878391 RepID=UPI001CEFF573|nr:hypothetical protein [Halomicrobium salinisoli]
MAGTGEPATRPVYADENVRKELRDSFVGLHGANGYNENAEMPVTFRKLPGVERIVRAHAKLEFSPTIEERHAQQAMELVGQSLQGYQKTEDGTPSTRTSARRARGRPRKTGSRTSSRRSKS